MNKNQHGNLTSLKNHFLIAMPTLMDPHFFHSVTYIFEHTSNGAVGIIVNQPLLSMRLGDILVQMGIRTDYPEVANQVIFNGGPVQQDRGFILHDNTTHWQSTLIISNTISLTTSPDILEAIARNEGPQHKLIAIGFVNWQAGQLETELLENSWLSGPIHSDILFHLSVEQRWRAAAALMGVDIDRLSSDIGHA